MASTQSAWWIFLQFSVALFVSCNAAEQSCAVKNLLWIKTSARSDAQSKSTLLGKTLVDRFAGAQVTLRDVGRNSLPLVDEAWMKAAFTNDPDKSPLKISDELIAELKFADLVVISLAIYNFAIPAGLKAWIDQVVRVGVSYPLPSVPGQPVRKVYILVASGGRIIREDHSTAVPPSFLPHSSLIPPSFLDISHTLSHTSRTSLVTLALFLTHSGGLHMTINKSSEAPHNPFPTDHGWGRIPNMTWPPGETGANLHYRGPPGEYRALLFIRWHARAGGKDPSSMRA